MPTPSPSTPSVLGQSCTAYLDSTGAQKFKIESYMESVLTGDLPHGEIFVHQVVVATDPKSDTFLRVANVVDLSTLPQGRDIAISKNQTIYLANEFTVVYDDIATASQAKLLIQQRVDNLIADWHSYNEQFLAPISVAPPNHRSDIPLPLTNGIVAQRTAAYSTAHAAYLVAKADQASAAATLASAVTAAGLANNAAISSVYDSQQCTTLLGQYNAAVAGASAYRTAVNTFMGVAKNFRDGIASSAEFDAAYTAMQSAVTTELVNASLLTGLQASMSSTCATKVAAVTTAANAKTTADAAVGTATTEKKAADDTLSTAQAADTAAYLAAAAVCPGLSRITP